MGAAGTDLILSPRAKSDFGHAIECKNVEALNFYKSMAQAEANARKIEGLTPMLICKRNKSEVYVALRFEDFLSILGAPVARK
jgi:hypothetical protein